MLPVAIMAALKWPASRASRNSILVSRSSRTFVSDIGVNTSRRHCIDDPMAGQVSGPPLPSQTRLTASEPRGILEVAVTGVAAQL